MAITRAPSGTSVTTLTADGAANTKGAWAEVVASTSEDVKAIWIVTNNTGTQGTRISVDIGTGAAAAEVVKIADIHWSNGDSARDNVPNLYIPISIPSGTRIAARCSSSSGGATNISVVLYLIGGSGGGTCVTYGVTTNQAVQVDPGGTINTKGAYSEITASTTADIAFLAVLIDMNVNAAPAGALFDVYIATGGAGSEADIIPRISWSSNAGSDHWTPVVHMFPVTIPSGTRISAAGMSSTNDATDRLFRVSLIGCTAVPT